MVVRLLLSSHSQASLCFLKIISPCSLKKLLFYVDLCSKRKVPASPLWKNPALCLDLLQKNLLENNIFSPCPPQKKYFLSLYGSPSLYGCVRISKISFKNIFSSQFIWQPYLIEYFLSFWEIYFGNPTFQTDHGTYHFN